MQKQIHTSESPYLQYLQYAVYGSVILYFGREVLIPVSFALLISFVLYPVCAWLERKGVGRLTAVVISLTVLIVIGLLLVALLVSQFVSFLDEWPTLQLKLNQSLTDLSEVLTNVFGISKDQQENMMTKLSDQSGSNLLVMVRNTITASAFSVVLLILIPVYAVLILYHRRYWVKILIRLFPSEREEELRKILSLTIGAYYNFIKGMAIIYLLVGSLNSVGLLLLGVPHAILFGFIASILTFIPYVGIIVGSLLPITMAWITYDSIWYPIGIIGIFTFVQYLEANVIFPVAVSSRLNVNTLVMLLSIFVGGILWGMAGMILFVPFVGIAKLVADHNPKWKTVSMMLGIENS
ncbi:MAG TPA: AI-2E family transporter [Chryseolinea sp.]|nr:AI-2E family transporter [Chryseolinea sp.]